MSLEGALTGSQGRQYPEALPVQTGLGLVEVFRITWFETDYSVYTITMRQASRRSWRIDQT